MILPFSFKSFNPHNNRVQSKYQIKIFEDGQLIFYMNDPVRYAYYFSGRRKTMAFIAKLS
jgi:hypothetical protein